jgi:prepilin-type N-terminal cleavage/methylation domain-containing protein
MIFMWMTRTGRGFSLIELLVVMGIIVALAATFSFALRGSGSGGVALQSAQAELAAMLGGTRAQAVLHQTSARLLIYATPPPLGDAEKYLRCLQIAREEPPGSDQWIAGSDAAYLPRGIFIVPPAVPDTHLASGIIWPAGQFAPVSTLASPTGFVLGGRSFGDAYCVAYEPDGRADPDISKLALATAHISHGAVPRFDNPSAVRGVRLRPAGSIGLVNTADDF